ncbi:MAG: hypothetical protein LBC07_02665 [Elusimicrobiota bacterium]|nr:hypothetical protein [Elusimicrobiota bacterium]
MKEIKKIWADFINSNNQFLRLCIGAFIGIFFGLIVFTLLIYFQPIENKAVDLTSGLVYMVDDNISNRLFALNVFLCFSFLSFIAFSLWPFSLTISNLLSNIKFPYYLFRRIIQFFAKNINVFLNILPAKNLNLERRVWLKYFFLALFFSYCIPPALSYLAILNPFFEITSRAIFIEQIALSIFVIFLWLFYPKQALKKFNFFAQFFVLPFFLIIFPAKIFTPQGLYFVNSIKLNIVFALLILCSIFDIIRRAKFNIGKKYFSPFALFAILLALVWHAGPIFAPMDNTYEFGSRLPAVWMSNLGLMRLFEDSYITYGLWDYLSINIGPFLFDKFDLTFASLGGAYVSMISSAIIFILARRLIPTCAAFIITLFVIPNGNLAMPIIFMLILLQKELLARPKLWIFVWGVLCALYPFARIPQGALAAAASFPAAAYQVFMVYKNNKKDFYQVIIFGAVLAFLVMVFPFGGYFKGIVRIVLETGTVNGVFAGTPFRQVFKMSFSQILHIIIFFIMPILAFICGYFIYKKNEFPKRSNFIFCFISTFSFFYCLFAISYSFSRIWDLSYARYTQSISIVSFVIFISLWAFFNDRKIKVLGSIFLMLLLCFSSLSIPTLKFSSGKYAVAGDIKNGKDFGVAMVGEGIFEASYAQEYQLVKKYLDEILSPDETFLNLTMDGNFYFVLDRKLWLEYPNWYVYPGNVPQRRAVDELEKRNIKVSLFDKRDVDDSLNINTRAYHLYRYALLNGLPFSISGNKTIVMPKEYFEKIGERAPNDFETFKIWDRHFARANNTNKNYDAETELFFANLPIVWGRSFKKFEPNLIEIKAIENFKPTDLTSDFVYNFGEDLDGRSVGLLYIDISNISAKDTAYLKISWINNDLPNEINEIVFIAHKGINLVPIDAAPRWLLAKRIGSIKIESDDKTLFSIKNIKLFDRTKI